MFIRFPTQAGHTYLPLPSFEYEKITSNAESKNTVCSPYLWRIQSGYAPIRKRNLEKSRLGKRHMDISKLNTCSQFCQARPEGGSQIRGIVLRIPGDRCTKPGGSLYEARRLVLRSPGDRSTKPGRWFYEAPDLAASSGPGFTKLRANV
jgi:hypothetical protein